jgi:hypothetical protein
MKGNWNGLEADYKRRRKGPKVNEKWRVKKSQHRKVLFHFWGENFP